MSVSMRTDPLAQLRTAAAKDPKAAVKEAARQFESLFMQELMKSMRQATMSSGLLDNEGTQLGTELLDTEFAGKMTGMKGGLADAIARQLERQMGIAAEAATAKPTVNRVSQTTPLRRPASARCNAAEQPVKPPPTTTASAISSSTRGGAGGPGGADVIQSP